MISTKYSVDDMQMKAAARQLTERLSQPQQPLKECGLVLLKSIAKNFNVGGRPTRWKKSDRARITGGKTLVNTRRLEKSIAMGVSGNTLTVNTVVRYARIHQLGGRITKNVTVREFSRHMDQAFGKPVKARRILVRAHQRKMNTNMPQRKFLLVQDEDYRVFAKIFQDHLTE